MEPPANKKKAGAWKLMGGERGDLSRGWKKGGRWLTAALGREREWKGPGQSTAPRRAAGQCGRGRHRRPGRNGGPMRSVTNTRFLLKEMRVAHQPGCDVGTTAEKGCGRWEVEWKQDSKIYILEKKCTDVRKTEKIFPPIPETKHREESA